ncbi:BolA family protein [Oceaniglobus trochenteri]|uniref:BolA family protein n=1 Tax=Oceaniglobus trochenteri TaxID=2763260 RepID=UPI001CFFF266|nr:BolA family protein [Oceaniglobus trochenteri]
MAVSDEIHARLEKAFQPTELHVEDESEAHRGHAGYQEGGESHFRVTITAPAFAPMTRIARHRAVHDAIGADLIGRIHALALVIKA